VSDGLTLGPDFDRENDAKPPCPFDATGPITVPGATIKVFTSLLYNFYLYLFH
jgi:hypothetical protein